MLSDRTFVGSDFDRKSIKFVAVQSALMEDTREELVCRLIIGKRRKGRRKKVPTKKYKIKMK